MMILLGFFLGALAIFSLFAIALGGPHSSGTGWIIIGLLSLITTLIIFLVTIGPSIIHFIHWIMS